MSDTPIWDQTVTDLYSPWNIWLGEPYFSEIVIGIANPKSILGTLRSAPWVVSREAVDQPGYSLWRDVERKWWRKYDSDFWQTVLHGPETVQDKADRYRER